MPLSRRRVLALGSTLLSVGCLGTGPASPDSDSRRSASGQSATSTSERESSDASNCEAGIDIWTDAFDPAADLPRTLDETERSLVAGAAAGDGAEYGTYAQAPIARDAFVAHDGAFYRTDYAVASVEQVPAFLMDVGWERGRKAPADAAVVAFDALPAADRKALRAAVLDPERRGLPSESLSVREFPAPYPDGGGDSRLVGDVARVRWRDRTFRVETAAESEATQRWRTFRYALERVAADAEEFRRRIADRYLVRLDGLPEDRRAIVERARTDGYEECEPRSEAIADLRGRLPDSGRLPEPHGDSWYVEFDGRRFRLRVSAWVV